MYSSTVISSRPSPSARKMTHRSNVGLGDVPRSPGASFAIPPIRTNPVRVFLTPITAEQRLLEEPHGDIGGDEGDEDNEDEDESGDSLSRRRNHLAHLIESAKMAVRAAIYAGIELDRHRGGT